MSARMNPPATDFPVGAPVTIVDAWGRNPVTGKVTRHVGPAELIVEDVRGIVHCGQTWRVTAAELSVEDMLS